MVPDFSDESPYAAVTFSGETTTWAQAGAETASMAPTPSTPLTTNDSRFIYYSYS